ncbi:glutamate-tRNA ligase [Infundibulicybe gibba]|nr:glutamate-tRNA ligase [Infundibulicybe gibba]
MTGTLTLSSKQSPFPFAAVAIAAYTGRAELAFIETAKGVTLDLDGQKLNNEEDIVHALAGAAGLSDDSANSSSFFALAKNLPSINAVPDVLVALDSLDDHLAFRTWDWIVWGALKGSIKIMGLLKNNQHLHILRWFSYLESLKPIQARSNKTLREGQVVTRFPPEPSGYLHIGHAKAAILNQYFAKMYKGKLIIRFDDTNPSKERTEFEDTILEDLKLLDVQGDIVTHTSDHFDALYNLALKMIKSGKAYTDDTEQLQMRDERGKGIASAHRDDSVENNLKHFEEMKSGSAEGLRWCLRAKISIDNPNKALRDPVIYRCNVLPHHRTGDKWKIYPTYDFACPAVDSIEGVTHALRTNEYRDRNPQYHWMIEALGLRKVNMWDFSRLNFIYTLLSKRKLHWFVDQGLVSGWDDPRFPTIRGIRRRGMTIEALTQFMFCITRMGFYWALNKKVIDPIAPRHWALVKDNLVLVTITGGPTEAEVKSVPKHKKNPDIGEKRRRNFVDDNEEITLMDWGNAIVRSKVFDESKKITSIQMDLNLNGDFRKTKKKITWLSHAPSASLVAVVLCDYDYLITKKKLEENDDVAAFVTPVTEFTEDALADANVHDLKPGDIMQFERKGYFVYDGEFIGVKKFIRIPDGKAANIASKAGVSTAAAVVTGSATPPVAPASKMYTVESVYGEDTQFEADTKMYKVGSVYES